ncbi:MAG: hypothetical protein FWG96_05275 [Methanomassiliicoccaceae archaeon]|nr:hypothetical protein [Methanomassiliicoccaceae archaeon]
MDAWNGDEDLTVAALRAIGSLIFGVLILFYGINVRGGSNDKVTILAGLVRVVGIITILAALFYAAADWLELESFSAGMGTFIVQIIVGLILLWVSVKIGGKSKNIVSKVLWVILIVAFVILALSALLGSIVCLVDGAWIDAIGLLCWLIVYIYALIATLSPDVKSSMGI